MSGVLWKGAISFGLLHAPVSLYTATRQDEIDFGGLRRGKPEPIVCKRVANESGEEVDKADGAAHPPLSRKATHTRSRASKTVHRSGRMPMPGHAVPGKLSAYHAKRDPAEKRLAVQVEDHPLDSIDFQGDMAAHQCGAGMWNIASLPGRLAQLRIDPWQDYFKTRPRLTEAMKRKIGIGGSSP